MLNMTKLIKNFSRYDMLKYILTQRIINIWNSLPVHAVNSKTYRVGFLPRDASAEHGDATVSRLSVRPSVRNV